MKSKLYNKSLLLLITIITLFLYQCEGYKCASGFVYDSSTKLPIDSVLCEPNSGYSIVYTDTLGAFDVCNRMGNCNFGCKDISVTFSKKGYKAKSIDNPDEELKVYLEKE